jgi:uncharacterized membrane protein YagU involved in acid resistance
MQRGMPPVRVRSQSIPRDRQPVSLRRAKRGYAASTLRRDLNREGALVRLLLRLLVGALGGLSATGPMTVLMILLHRILPAQHRYSLPPREIVAELARKTALHKHLGADARAALTLINHFAYGAMAATMYALVEGRSPPAALIKGPIFGALVWLVSYLGLLPLAGILESGTKHPASRNWLMIAAHLVWGFFVALFVETVLGEEQKKSGALFSGSPLPQKDRK